MVYQMVWSAEVQTNAGLTTGEMTEQAEGLATQTDILEVVFSDF